MTGEAGIPGPRTTKNQATPAAARLNDAAPIDSEEEWSGDGPG